MASFARWECVVLHRPRLSRVSVFGSQLNYFNSEPPLYLFYVNGLPCSDKVGVHIADVTHFIRPGTALDDEAANRGTTVYLTDKVSCYISLSHLLSIVTYTTWYRSLISSLNTLGGDFLKHV